MARWIKYIVGGLAVAGAVAVLSMPGRGREGAPEGRVVIRYWEKWSGKEGADMQGIVDKFNATVGAEKNIWVTYVSMSTVEQKTLVSTAAGDPPDVAGLFEKQTAQFGAINALEPLDKYAAEHGIVAERYKPAYWDACTYEGVLYALPSTPAVVALHYNKLLFAKSAEKLRAAGLDPGRPPRTIAELDAYSAAIDRWEGAPGAGGKLVVAGYIPSEPGWWIAQTPVWFGAPIYDEKTHKVTLTDAATMASFKWLEGYPKRLGVEQLRRFKAGLATNFDSPQSPFFAQSVAMEQEGTWKANYVGMHAPELGNPNHLSAEALAGMSREQRRENTGWAVAAFPSAVPGVEDACLATVDTLVIPRTSHHKREAFEFIAFVNRPEVMEELVSLHCKNSPFRVQSAGYIANHPNPYIETFEKLADSPHAVHLPKAPVWAEIDAELTAVSERILLGQATPEELLPATEKRCQAMVDRFFERQGMRAGGAGVAEGAGGKGAAQ